MCVSSHKLLVLPFLSGERFFLFLMQAVLIGFSSLPLMTIFDICVTLRQFMLIELRFVLPFSYSCLPSIVSYMVSNFFLSMSLWKSIKSLQNRWMKLYERSSNISSLMLFGHERERLMCTSPMNSKQQLASTQPKMIIVLPLRSLRATLMGNWEKAQSTYSSRSTTKNWRKQKREGEAVNSQQKKRAPSDSGWEWPAGASLDKGTHESWHPSEYLSCAGSCCGRDSQNSTSTITSWDQMGMQLVPTSNLTVAGTLSGELLPLQVISLPREDWKGPPHIRFSQWLCVAHHKQLGKWRNDTLLHWEHPHTLH